MLIRQPLSHTVLGGLHRLLTICFLVITVNLLTISLIVHSPNHLPPKGLKRKGWDVKIPLDCFCLPNREGEHCRYGCPLTVEFHPCYAVVRKPCIAKLHIGHWVSHFHRTSSQQIELAPLRVFLFPSQIYVAEISSSTREKLQQFSRTPCKTKFQLLLHRKIKVKSSFRELLMEKVVRIEDHIPKNLGVICLQVFLF